MLSCHELFGFMAPETAEAIVNHAFTEEKELYRATLAAVAEARRVRPVFLQKLPRDKRHKTMIQVLTRPSMEEAAAGLIRGWLMGERRELLRDFLDALEIEHDDGVVEDLPAEVDAAKLSSAVDNILAKHSPEVVVIYLHAFNSMNDTRWEKLDRMLEEDARLQLA